MIHLQAFDAFCYSYQQRGRDSPENPLNWPRNQLIAGF